MKDLIPESRYGIICPQHGKQGLSYREYNQQMLNADELWRCPVRDCPSVLVRWDDERYEATGSDL